MKHSQELLSDYQDIKEGKKAEGEPQLETRVILAEMVLAIKGLSYTLQNIQDKLSRYQTGRH